MYESWESKSPKNGIFHYHLIINRIKRYPILGIFQTFPQPLQFRFIESD